jgi:hypothetical protein
LEGGGGGNGDTLGALLLLLLLLLSLLLLLLLEEKDVSPRLELLCHASKEPTDADGSVGHLVAYWAIPRERCRTPSNTNEAMARFMLLTADKTECAIYSLCLLVCLWLVRWFVSAGVYQREADFCFLCPIVEDVDCDDVDDECVHV